MTGPWSVSRVLRAAMGRRKKPVQSHLQKLRIKLFQAFNRRGITTHRSIFPTNASLVELIRAHGLSVDRVASIIPPNNEDDVRDMRAYRFKLTADRKDRKMNEEMEEMDRQIHRPDPSMDAMREIFFPSSTSSSTHV